MNGAAPTGVLIAGCGDVGTRLARRMAARGLRVVALSRSGRAPAGVAAVAADLADASTLSRLPAGLDTVVYLPSPGAREADAYRRVFLGGPRNLLQALPAAPRRFVFVSSTAVYGQDRGEWVNEDTAPAPPSFNGEILLEAEQALAAQLPAVVVARLAGLYGPGREHLLRRARSGEPAAPRWGNRIHVGDAAAALEHLALLPALRPLYLVADGAPARDDEVLAWLRERMGLPPLTPLQAPESGRRVAVQRLAGTGFVPVFADYRAGYGPLVGDERSD